MDERMERLEAAFLLQILAAMELDGVIDEPFAFESARQKAQEMLALYENRDIILDIDPKDVKQADFYAEFGQPSIEA